MKYGDTTCALENIPFIYHHQQQQDLATTTTTTTTDNNNKYNDRTNYSH